MSLFIKILRAAAVVPPGLVTLIRKLVGSSSDVSASNPAPTTVAFAKALVALSGLYLESGLLNDCRK